MRFVFLGVFSEFYSLINEEIIDKWGVYLLGYMVLEEKSDFCIEVVICFY